MPARPFPDASFSLTTLSYAPDRGGSRHQDPAALTGDAVAVGDVVLNHVGKDLDAVWLASVIPQSSSLFTDQSAAIVLRGRRPELVRHQDPARVA